MGLFMLAVILGTILGTTHGQAIFGYDGIILSPQQIQQLQPQIQIQPPQNLIQPQQVIFSEPQPQFFVQPQIVSDSQPQIFVQPQISPEPQFFEPQFASEPQFFEPQFASEPLFSEPRIFARAPVAVFDPSQSAEVRVQQPQQDQYQQGAQREGDLQETFDRQREALEQQEREQEIIRQQAELQARFRQQEQARQQAELQAIFRQQQEQARQQAELQAIFRQQEQARQQAELQAIFRQQQEQERLQQLLQFQQQTSIFNPEYVGQDLGFLGRDQSSTVSFTVSEPHSVSQRTITFLPTVQATQSVQPIQQFGLPLNQPSVQVMSVESSGSCTNRRLVDDSGLVREYHFSWCDDGGRAYSFSEAREYCQGLGEGWQPVSVENRRKDEFVANALLEFNVKYIWTCGNRLNTATWVWCEGIVPSGYTNWSDRGQLEGVGQPDNAEGMTRGNAELCLGILNNFYNDGVKWHDIACHHEKPVICQGPPIPQSTLH